MAYGLLQTGPWLLSTITTLIILHARYCRALPFERSNQTTDERLNNHTALNMLGIACVSFCVYWTARIVCQSSSEPYKFNTAASVSYIYKKYGHKHWVKLMFIFVCIIWGVNWERKKSLTSVSSYLASCCIISSVTASFFQPKLGQGHG